MPHPPYVPRLGPAGAGYQGQSISLRCCWKCSRYKVETEDEFGLCDDCKVILRDPEYKDSTHFPKSPDADREVS